MVDFYCDRNSKLVGYVNVVSKRPGIAEYVMATERRLNHGIGVSIIWLVFHTALLFLGVYDQDAPEELLLARPYLYRQGRLGLVYKPHSFWITMADSLYQSIVIFFLTEGVSHC
jgi:hypothetical protein